MSGGYESKRARAEGYANLYLGSRDFEDVRGRLFSALTNAFMAGAEAAEKNTSEIVRVLALPHCSQCGQPFEGPSCGPTHALLTAERAKACPALAAVAPFRARAKVEEEMSYRLRAAGRRLANAACGLLGTADSAAKREQLRERAMAWDATDQETIAQLAASDRVAVIAQAGGD